MSHLFVCPHCKKSLRTAAALPAGKQIKCPACKNAFAIDGAETGVRARTPVLAKSAPPIPMGLQAKAPARTTRLPDPFDDDLEEVRPRRSADSTGSIRIVPKRSAGKLGLLLALLSGAVALVVLGITAFVWPGFLVQGRPVSQAPTLLAYVPPNSTVLAGAQIGLFRTQPLFQAKWNDIQQQIAQLPNFPPDARELLNDVDEIIVAGSPDLQGSAVFVASTQRPYDVEKVKRLAKAGAPLSVQGQTLYPAENLVAGKTAFLALPTDKIIVLGFLPKEDLAKVLGGIKQARLHPDLQEQVNQAHTGLVWIAARFDDGMKRQLNQANAQLGPMAAIMGPDFATFVGTVQRGKGALLSVDVGDRDLKLSVGVTCRDATDANQCHTSLNNFWNNQGKQFLAMGDIFGAGVPGLGKLLGEVRQSFAVEQRGATVIASIQLNQDTLLVLADALPRMNPGFPGMNPGLPPFPKKF